MSYREWRDKLGNAYTPPDGWSLRFWAIVDFNWIPAEQNELARLWKAWSPD